ncbi:hypothetical protein GGR56DRAFT_674526 [Xylariaceae sp. FL0804]|nr:hypothetical protein GGR56DRAFT_674526 [Xylariaceae sp. FL0804]
MERAYGHGARVRLERTYGNGVTGSPNWESRKLRTPADLFITDEQGAVNCHNKVAQFGDRCKLCLVMNEGSSARYDLFQALPCSVETDPANHDHDGSRSSRSDSQEEQQRRGRARERKHF